MIVGTAGHIDHGKTSLIRALTGRDTDRLPEEKQRGISIELGYAFLPLAGGRTLAFVDVPGHERFVHTMVSGATGVDAAMLVIAADDGVMPQTVEHLDILRLLGVDRGVVAVTKVDAVDGARRSTVRAEIAAWLAGTPAAAWPVFEVAAPTGEGVASLRDHLLLDAQAVEERATSGRFRLAVDRVFTLSGIGTIVTGTAHAGVVRIGDEVEIVPGGLRARVRSIHAQDAARADGRAGERCALNLVGVGKDEIARGSWVQHAGLANGTQRLDAAVRISSLEPRPLESGATLQLHHGADDVAVRVAVLDHKSLGAGEHGLVGFTLDRPLGVCMGDRFILRDAAARRTVGGGAVLDIAPPVRYRRAPARLALLAHLRDDERDEALAAWLDHEPVPIDRIVAGWNLSEPELREACAGAGARVAGGCAFSRGHWARLSDAVRVTVGSAHEREPEMPGIEQKRLQRIVAPRLPADAFVELLAELIAGDVLVRHGAFLAFPSHRAELARDERIAWERIKPALLDARFQPPRVRDIARDTGFGEGNVRALLRKVARVGEVTLVAHDHYFLTEAVCELADIAARIAATDGVARAGPFRDAIGGGRKLAIQILEFFDRVGYTRRVRDDHLLRGANPWRTQERAAA